MILSPHFMHFVIFLTKMMMRINLFEVNSCITDLYFVYECVVGLAVLGSVEQGWGSVWKKCFAFVAIFASGCWCFPPSLILMWVLHMLVHVFDTRQNNNCRKRRY